MRNNNALPFDSLAETDPTDPFYQAKYDPNSPEYEGRRISETERGGPAIERGKEGKKRKANSFEPKTDEYMARRGYMCAKCSKWVIDYFYDKETRSRVPVRTRSEDLFGFMDQIAFKRGELGAIAIQTTSVDNMGGRIRSAITNAKKGDTKNPNRGVALVHWLMAGNRFLVIGWHKPGRLWECQIIEVTLKVVELVQSGGRLNLIDLKVSDLPSGRAV